MTSISAQPAKWTRARGWWLATGLGVCALIGGLWLLLAPVGNGSPNLAMVETCGSAVAPSTVGRFEDVSTCLDTLSWHRTYGWSLVIVGLPMAIGGAARTRFLSRLT